MVTSFNRLGLSHSEIEKKIDAELDKNADVMMGIDDPETQEMLEVLKKAFVEAIVENNKKIEDDLEEVIKLTKMRF